MTLLSNYINSYQDHTLLVYKTSKHVYFVPRVLINKVQAKKKKHINPIKNRVLPDVPMNLPGLFLVPLALKLLRIG